MKLEYLNVTNMFKCGSLHSTKKKNQHKPVSKGKENFAPSRTFELDDLISQCYLFNLLAISDKTVAETAQVFICFLRCFSSKSCQNNQRVVFFLNKKGRGEKKTQLLQLLTSDHVCLFR